MKLGLVTKLDKRNKTASKKFGDDVMSVNWDVIVIFPIYGQFDNLEASILRMISVSLFINKLISWLHQRKEMSDFTNV